jgi:hypothetical protein
MICVIFSDSCCIAVVFIARFVLHVQLWCLNRHIVVTLLLVVRGFVVEKKGMDKDGSKNDP